MLMISFGQEVKNLKTSTVTCKVFKVGKENTKPFKCCEIDLTCIDTNIYLNPDKYTGNISLFHMDSIRALQKDLGLTENEKHLLRY